MKFGYAIVYVDSVIVLSTHCFLHSVILAHGDLEK